MWGTAATLTPSQSAPARLEPPGAWHGEEPSMQDERTGYCECGCGGRTEIADRTRTGRGDRRGEPRRFIKGHNGRAPCQFDVRDCGYETPCWVWLLERGRGGYGRLKSEGQRFLAHRFYYVLHRGPIPAGLQLDHLCRNPACVNPDHLEPVTAAVNVRRNAHTRLTEQEAREIRSLRLSGVPGHEVARRYGISEALVCDIKHGRAWRGI